MSLQLAFQKKMFKIVSKICAEASPPICTSTEADVDYVLATLLNSNSEFEKQGAHTHRQAVAEALSSYVFQLKPPVAARPLVANSNNILPYGRNSSNKRMVPADVNDVVNSPPAPTSAPLPSSTSAQDGEAPPKRAKKNSKAHQKHLSKETIAHLEAQVEEATAAAMWKPTQRPTARLNDLAGMDSILSATKELVFYPMLENVLSHT